MGATTESKAEFLKDLTPDDINNMYKQREISKEQQLGMLQDKAIMTMEGELKDGYLNAVGQEIMKNLTQAWDNIKEAAQHDVRVAPEEGLIESTYKGAKRELYYSLLASWGMIQGLMSVQNAVGTVTGKEATLQALRWGASPGLAHAVGFATDMGINFMPAGTVAKGLAKGLRAAMPGKAGQAAYEAAKAAREITGAGGEVLGYMSNEGVVVKTLAEALERDGIYNSKILLGEAAKAADRSEGVVKTIEEAAPQMAAKGTEGVLEASGQTLSAQAFIDEAAEFTKRVNKEEVAGRLKALTEKFGIDYEAVQAAIGPWYRMSTKGAPVTDKQLYGYLKALEARSDKLVELANNAVKQGATNAEREAFAAYAADLFTAASEKIGSKKEMTNLLAYWNPEAVAKGELQLAMDSFAKAITQMGDMNPSALPKAVMKMQETAVKEISGGAGTMGSAVWPRAKEIMHGMLMPLSWTSTTIGNFITLGEQIAERFSVNPWGALHMSQGAVLALSDAASAANNAWRIGYRSGSHYFPLYSMLTTETTMASDAFFKVVMQRAHLYDMAFQEAKALGLTGAARGAHVANRVANPTIDMVAAANEQAIRGTFNADFTSWMGKWIQELAASDNPSSLYFLFIRSGTNLAKWAYHRLPGIQFAQKQLYKDILAGGDRMERAIATLTFSNFAGFFYYEMAKHGFYTGQGPAAPYLQREWRIKNEPNSWKTPTGWMPMAGLEPLNMQMQAIANFVEISEEVDDPTLEQFAAITALSLTRAVTDRTVWRSIATYVEAVNGIMHADPNVTIPKEVALTNPLASIVSGGAVGSAIKRGTDPAARDARTWVDGIRARTFWGSTDVPPLRDGYGDVVIPPQPMYGNSWFGLMGSFMPKYRPDETDRVKLEGYRLQARLPYFSDQIGSGDHPGDFDITGVQPGERVPTPLNKWQRDRWQQIYKNIVRGDGSKQNPGIEAGLLDQPFYNDMTKMTLADQKAEFEHFLQDAKRQATEALIAEDANLAEAVRRNEAARELAGIADPVIRERVRQGYEKERLDYEAHSPQERENLLNFGILAPDEPVVRDNKTLYEPREPMTGLTIKRTPEGEVIKE